MPYIKRFNQQHISISDLFTLQERPGWLEYKIYMGNPPGKAGG